MELNFKVPMGPGRGQAAAVRGTPNLSNPRATPHSGSVRSGTYRFALDSRPRHTRRSSTRARTGCSTCKKRHVKCDEAKPECQNCIKWGGRCDGYGDNGEGEGLELSRTSVQLVHDKRAPLLLKEPPVNTIRFATSQQRLYFDTWTKMSVQFLSGGVGQTRLWTATMPQVTLEETSLRFGAMAVGALRQAYLTEGLNANLTTDNRHYLNAVAYYCEALKLQAKARPTKDGLRTALIASLLFICFETQRGNMPASLKHISHGFSMLNELATCTENAPDLVRMAQAPPSMVQDLLDCYRPLELQSRTFMGSYRKIFFPTGQPPALLPPTSNADISAASAISARSRTTLGEAKSVLPKDANADRSGAAGQISPTGVPSHLPLRPPGPPRTSTDPRPIAPAPAAGAQKSSKRPAGIIPFTARSPYYHPKYTTVGKLDDMPSEFTSYDESFVYWTLIMRQMVQYIPMLTMVTTQLYLPLQKTDEDLLAKLLTVKKHPKIEKLIVESRYWLQRWLTAFDPFFQGAADNAHHDAEAYLGAVNLKIEYLLLWIYLAIPRFSDLETARALTPQYREITILAEILLAARPNCGFAMDSGWTWPLFVSSFGCRDESVREDAIRILGQYPVRNALSDSRVFRGISLKNREIERLCAEQLSNENEQWLQLRRRELVFEESGSRVVFRSPVRDSETGMWRCREEVADFMVKEDGLLDWRERPISDSMSILSGVC